MMLGNTPTRYGLPARLLHWSLAVLVLGLIGLGWWMMGLSYYDAWYYAAREWHAALGLAAWLLGLAFALGHLANRPPPSLPLAPWERAAAWAAHKLLYLALLLLPAAGYLILTADGNAFVLFGWVSLPPLFAPNEAVREAAAAVHAWGAYGLLGLVGVHAGAALKHHFLNRDRTLLRMLRGD
jgi:cytochrome b561